MDKKDVLLKFISTQGYRKNSPDKNNPFNIIPSNRISMREDDGSPLEAGPIFAQDNRGNKNVLLPGGEYQFPGEYVFETPMAQDGGLAERQKKQSNDNTKFLIDMSNSPLFAERYAKMTGSTDLTEMENFRKSIKDNLNTLSIKDINDNTLMDNVSLKTLKADAAYDENKHNIIFKKDLSETKYPFTNLHEQSHGSTKGQLTFKNPYKFDPIKAFDDLHKKEKEILGDKYEAYKAFDMKNNNRYGGKDLKNYFSDPSEIKARKDVATKLLSDFGQFDPINDKFNEDTYDLLKKFGETNSNVLDLLENFPKEEVIRMFNEIVSNNKTQNLDIAQVGGYTGEKPNTQPSIIGTLEKTSLSDRWDDLQEKWGDDAREWFNKTFPNFQSEVNIVKKNLKDPIYNFWQKMPKSYLPLSKEDIDYYSQPADDGNRYMQKNQVKNNYADQYLQNLYDSYMYPESSSNNKAILEYQNGGTGMFVRQDLNFSNMPKQTPEQQKAQDLMLFLKNYNEEKLKKGKQEFQKVNDPNESDNVGALKGMWEMAQLVDPTPVTNITNIGVNKLLEKDQQIGDYAGIAASLIPYGKQGMKAAKLTKPILKRLLEFVDKGEDAYGVVKSGYQKDGGKIMYENGGNNTTQTPVPTKGERRKKYVESIQDNMYSYLENTGYKTPHVPGKTKDYLNRDMNCIHGMCQLLEGSGATKFSQEYFGNMVFNDNLKKEGYYDVDAHEEGFDTGDLLRFSRRKGNINARFDGSVTPLNENELIPQHTSLIIDKYKGDDGTTMYSIANNYGGEKVETSEYSEEDLMKWYDNGKLTFDRMLVNRYDPDKVEEINLEQESVNKILSGDNAYASRYDKRKPSIILKNADGLSNNLLKAYEKNYEKIGKSSDLPPEILDKLFIKQLGIVKQESSLGPRLVIKSGIPDVALPLARKLADVFGEDHNWMEDYWKKNADNVQSKYKTFEDFTNKLTQDLKLSKEAREYLRYNGPESKGLFQQKDLSKRGRYHKSGFDTPEQQLVSSLDLAVDNYHKLAKKYPDYTPNQLVELTTLMHNAPFKALTKEFVDYYFKNNDVDYINKVNAFIPEHEISKTELQSFIEKQKNHDIYEKRKQAEKNYKAKTQVSNEEAEAIKAFVSKLPKKQDGGNIILDDIYSMYPAMKNMGKVTLKADPEFTRAKTGVGDIEYFRPDSTGRGSVKYKNGFEYNHPDSSKSSHGVVYNPETNNTQSIFLDMLHGMNDSDPQYRKLRNDYKTVMLKDFKNDFEGDFQRYIDENDGDDGDGRAAFIENWVDGKIRNLLFEGTPEDFEKARYNPNEREIYLASPKVNKTFSKLHAYLMTNQVPKEDMVYTLSEVEVKPEKKSNDNSLKSKVTKDVQNIKNLLSLTNQY